MIHQIAREIVGWQAQRMDGKMPSRVRVTQAVMDVLEEDIKRMDLVPTKDIGGVKIMGVPIEVDLGMTTGVIEA